MFPAHLSHVHVAAGLCLTFTVVKRSFVSRSFLTHTRYALTVNTLLLRYILGYREWLCAATELPVRSVGPVQRAQWQFRYGERMNSQNAAAARNTHDSEAKALIACAWQKEVDGQEFPALTLSPPTLPLCPPARRTGYRFPLSNQ